jgi:hypothetical protein
MQTAPYKAPSDANHWRRLLFSNLTAILTGLATAYLRAYFERSNLHYETIASCFLILPAISLILAFTARRLPILAALTWLMLEVLLVYVFFTLSFWLLYLFLVPSEAILPVMLKAMAICWLVSALVSAIIIALLAKFRPPILGPHCRGCGYCLIGLPSNRCPECGRTFTDQEVSLKDLILYAPSLQGVIPERDKSPMRNVDFGDNC